MRSVPEALKFEVDEPVSWHSKPENGRHSPVPVAAVVRQIGGARIQIETRVKRGKATEWRSRLVWVSANELSKRKTPSPAFGEQAKVKEKVRT